MADLKTHHSTEPNPQTRAFGVLPGVSRKQLMAGAIGNLIEWFDWNAYALLAVYLSAHFFPTDASPLVALLGTFGIMAVGFIVRPVAGLVMGWLADRIGRKPTLMLTVYGMGAASLLIAIAPTYEQIGFFAPVLLLLARIVQGLCIGGEYASLSAFAMEMAPTGKRGKVAAFLCVVAIIGQVAGAVVILFFTWVLPGDSMAEWGWRLVFGIGALLALGGIWMRRGMKETLDVEEAKERRVGVFAAMVSHPKQTLQVVGMILGFTAMVYAWGAYMPAYATTYAGLDTKDTMTALLISLICAGLFGIVAGYLSDRFGRKATMIAAGVILSVGTVPMLGLLNDQLWTLIVAQSFGQMVLMLLQASSMPAMAEMFPRDFRAAGLGFPYSLTVGLVGGTVPMVGTQLANLGWGSAFPWYLTVLMVVSTIVYIFMKETAFSPLPK